jgi:integrase
MGGQHGRRQRSRGNVEQLPSGALRVRIYAGIDPVTRKRHVLSQLVPPGPNAAVEAEKARVRLLNQI